MFPASHGTRTTPARPHEVHSPIGPRPVPWANSATKFTTSAGQRKLVAHGPARKPTSKHFQMCLPTTICMRPVPSDPLVIQTISSMRKLSTQ
jgi:hypothetical protein